MRIGIWMILGSSLLLALPAACTGSLDGNAPPPSSMPLVPAVAAVPRLTTAQYRQAIVDLIGPDAPIGELEPDTSPFLFSTIGAARSTLSSRGAELFEASALRIASYAMGDSSRRERLIGCTPSSLDDVCVTRFVERFARRAFRRRITTEERDRWLRVGRESSDGDAIRGLESILAAILQSPSFLYRMEIGVEVPVTGGSSPEARPTHGTSSQRRIEGFDLASRLSFVLWRSVPDEELLDAAEHGGLEMPMQLRNQVERMLEDPRARDTIAGFFDEYLGLAPLASLDRDAALFPAWEAGMGGSMRTEIEHLVADVVFERDADFRTMFNTRNTFVDERLARLYGVTMPRERLSDGFARVTLPEDGPRAGLLATGGWMSLNAHPNLTSPTRRGKYIRERLLCELVVAPPDNVPLDLGEEMHPGGERRTLRERLAAHRVRSDCALCHASLDPVGLGLEDFDAMGAHRTLEVGRPVDASGDLDGQSFTGARELGEILRTDERVPRCVVRQLYRSSVARLETAGERQGLHQLEVAFREHGYSIRSLLIELVTSEVFRASAVPEGVLEP